MEVCCDYLVLDFWNVLQYKTVMTDFHRCEVQQCLVHLNGHGAQ